MLTEALVVAFFVVGLQLMVPILWAALGETLMEQSGILNVGVEGVMLIGAVATALAGVGTGHLGAAVAAGVGAGLLCGAVLAGLYVKLGSDQIVTGLMFNIFALGLTGVLHSRFLGGRVGPTLPRLDVGVLGSVPGIGPVLSSQNVLLYASLCAAVAVSFALRHTWWGLYARASGQRPAAVEAAGIDVRSIRYPAVVFGCALSAIGGTTLVLGTSGGFVPGMTSGRGFIALGVVVLARWRPSLIVLAASLFGLTQAFQFIGRRLDLLAEVPAQLWLALPYLLTITMVTLAAGSRYPAAVGIPYRR